MISEFSHWAMLACWKMISSKVLYGGGRVIISAGSGSDMIGMMKIVIKRQRIAGFYGS